MRASTSAEEESGRSGFLKKIFKGDFYKKLLIFLTLFVTLALLFQFRESRLETFELGTKSEKYVLAQVDFEYLDEESRSVAQQEASLDIGTIEKFDAFEVDQYIDLLETKWRTDEKQSKVGVTSKEVQPVLKGVRKNLKKTRIASKRTLRAAKDYVDAAELSLYLVGNPEATQFRIGITEDNQTYWNALFAEDAAHSLDPAIFNAISSFVKARLSQVDFTLETDPREQLRLREIVQQQVPSQKKAVEAGKSIIRKGETVTMRHLTMLSAMKRAMSSSRNLYAFLPMMGNVLLALIFTLLGTTYLRVKHSDMFHSLEKLAMLVTISVLTIWFAKGTEYLLLREEHHYFSFIRYPVYVPFASVFIAILMGMEVALFATGFLAVVLAISLAVDIDRFLVINLVAAVVGIIASRFVRKRREIYAVFFRMLLSCAVVIITFNLMENSLWNQNSLQDLAVTAIFLFGCATLIVSLLPLIESIFNTMTSMRLIEYLDPSHPLLMRMIKEAKPTYSHSLAVANLAESAATSINANGLFCRVASYYHDVGKLWGPLLYTENQNAKCNMGTILANEEYAQQIIKHVEYGVELARKANLPRPIIDIIRQHHGTTLLSYFYDKELERMHGDPLLIDESQYRYPGPKPRSKEAVIIMITDSAEAACRSLTEVTEQTVQNKIRQVINGKMSDGQFDESPISLSELRQVEKTLVAEILAEKHVRIKYPSSTP